MTAQKGKDLLVKIAGGGGYTTVAGLRTRRLAFNTESVDITHAESANRWRELLDGAGIKRASVSGRGLFKDATSDALMRQAFFAGSVVGHQIVIPDCRRADLHGGVAWPIVTAVRSRPKSAARGYGVNSGTGRSGKVLRRMLGLPDDSSTVTDAVIAAARAADPKILIAAICGERLRFLQALKTWPVFGAGWGRRVAEVKSTALKMAADAAKASTMARTK